MPLQMKAEPDAKDAIPPGPEGVTATGERVLKFERDLSGHPVCNDCGHTHYFSIGTDDSLPFGLCRTPQCPCRVPNYLRASQQESQ